MGMGIGALESALFGGMVDKNERGAWVGFAQGLISFISSPALEIFIFIFFCPPDSGGLTPKMLVSFRWFDRKNNRGIVRQLC